MKEINWNVFKAKFNGKETTIFESLTYQLFCVEHSINTGIFRFKNQAGIETDPIQIEDDLVGFQAKFYDTKISENKDNIIASIVKAKRENTNLNRILFYLNQEFLESSKKGKKDPEYKTEIEQIAKSNAITIEWRVPSHFERQLALPENQYLTDFFFDQGKNVIDFIEDLKSHTENLFLAIQTDIVFKNQAIKIDRTSIVQELFDNISKQQTIILSGDGGCGKTAIIKDLYQKAGNTIPFYTFKAVEFNIQQIKSLFDNYGSYSLNEFIRAHENESTKVIVIDSAERISDLEYQEPFKEFIAALLKDSWSIIFTTRLSYLEDLRFQFLSIYRLAFEEINLNALSLGELHELASTHSFELPSNDKMKNLISNPFYLDEYLKNYDSYGTSVQYRQFKDTIWQSKIQKSTFKKNNTHILREKCFLSIAQARSEQGAFYVHSTSCSEEILSLLQNDDIIGFDKKSGGYFITHDIYEEWGLNMFIDRAFNSATDYHGFITIIGTSLAVRRAFRQWLSDKLFDSVDDVRLFIEEIFIDENVQTFWKDEIVTSILLSDYSDEFFNRFKDEIVKQDYFLFKKISFLLRVSCKKVDESIKKALIKVNDVSLNYVFTQPKGLGWESVISFLYLNKEVLPVSLLPSIQPLLFDWCYNNKTGDTTRKAGLLALKFYIDIQTDDEYRYNSDIRKQLIEIVLYSAIEIKDELAKAFDEVIENGDLNSESPYYKLYKTVISSKESNICVIKALPEYVLKFAELYWFESNPKDYYGHGVDHYYGIRVSAEDKYFPASAIQTPIYWLLRFSFTKTIDFIIDFTNRAIKNYADSKFDSSIQEVNLNTIGDIVKKQYVSQNLWGMYRGCGSPVTPYLVQSVHMALEKRLLELAETSDPKITESWLGYLISKSNSASITAIVTSVVLAYPNKFFTIAKILFSTRALFTYDNIRCRMGESEAKGVYSIGRGMDYKTQKFEDERLKTCDDKHRSTSLENLIVRYQFWRDDTVSESEAEQRQKEVWEIIDKLHSELPEKENETDEDKTTRLLLARIDRRKMRPKTEWQDDNTMIIDFNPQIEPDLRAHAQEALDANAAKTKYMDLFVWAHGKFESSEKYKNYRYENNPDLVLKETKEILDGMTNNTIDFYAYTIPAFTASFLVKHHASSLSAEDQKLCLDIIKDYAADAIRPEYAYQISDGVEVAISAAPYVIELFPEEHENVLVFLMLILFDRTSIGNYKRVCDYSIESILNRLWQTSPEGGKKILIGFLKFKPVLDAIIEATKKSSVKTYGWPRYTQSEVIETLTKDHGRSIYDFMSSPLEIEDLDISKYPLDDLEIAFQLIPHDTQDEVLMALISQVLPVFAHTLLKKGDKIDYSLRRRIFTKFSHYILFRELKDISKNIQPFVDNFTATQETEFFLHEIISSQDQFNQYEQFWPVWDSFYEKIKVIKTLRGYESSGVIHAYLLAWPYWKKTATTWHTLKENDTAFYKKVVKDMGHLPSVLDSISKILNEVASEYIGEGIFWICEMIEKNRNNKLEVNTVYYVEKLVRKYIFLNRTKIKQNIKTKEKVLGLLNFLIEQSSVEAYLLREDIL